MKKIFIILFCFFFLFSSAQNNRFTSYLDVYFGYRTHIATFYDQINTFNSFNLSSPLQTVGIRWNEYYFTQSFTTFAGLGYSQVLPQVIYVQDTLKGKITGGILSFNAGFLFITKSANLHCYLGFNTGRLRMYQRELIKQKNPFFSPKIGVQPWLKLGKLALTAIVEYEYDVSKTEWRRTSFANKTKAEIAPLRQSAMTVQAGISFSF